VRFVLRGELLRVLCCAFELLRVLCCCAFCVERRVVRFRRVVLKVAVRFVLRVVCVLCGMRQRM
jgi:hypothetical protein